MSFWSTQLMGMKKERQPENPRHVYVNGGGKIAKTILVSFFAIHRGIQEKNDNTTIRSDDSCPLDEQTRSCQDDRVILAFSFFPVFLFLFFWFLWLIVLWRKTDGGEQSVVVELEIAFAGDWCINPLLMKHPL